MLCGGVFLQGKIHMPYFFATREKALIFLSLISILATTGVLAGKLFKALPAAVQIFGLLAFLDFLQELFDGLFQRPAHLAWLRQQ